MKKNLFKFRFLTFLLTAIFFLSLASCGKKDSADDSDDDNNNTTATTSNMTAIVDGNSWYSNTAYNTTDNAAYAEVYINSDSTYEVNIIGDHYYFTNSLYTGYDIISLSVFKLSGTGTFNLNTTAEDARGTFYTLDGTTYTYEAYSTDSVNSGYTGTLVVTKFDYANKKISGTFSFNANEYAPMDSTGSVSITEGKFTDVTWQ